MGTCYSAMSVWTYLGKRWNDAYGKDKLIANPELL